MAVEQYKGIGLPTTTRKYPAMKTEEALIKDSVITILLTTIGQRFYVPDFGSRLLDLVWEPNDLVLSTLAQEYVREALGRWEPRVAVVNVQTSAEEHILTIVITYAIVRLARVIQLPLQISRDTGAVTVG